VPDAEGVSDGSQILVAALEVEGGGATGHLRSFDAHQRIEDLLGDAVGEKYSWSPSGLRSATASTAIEGASSATPSTASEAPPGLSSQPAPSPMPRTTSRALIARVRLPSSEGTGVSPPAAARASASLHHQLALWKRGDQRCLTMHDRAR
jgi:hypothetical protein